MTQPTRDAQTVAADGQPTQPLIADVRMRRAVTHEDDRGTICEVLSESWAFDGEPLVHVYQVTIRPGKIKGWVIHHEQEDRLFFSRGAIHVVLYDARTDSPTSGLVNEFYFSEHNRTLLRIPRGVYHALRNVGHEDAMFFNLPTRAYDHAAPDKYRLPLDTDTIPYRFTDRMGG